MIHSQNTNIHDGRQADYPSFVVQGRSKMENMPQPSLFSTAIEHLAIRASKQNLQVSIVLPSSVSFIQATSSVKMRGRSQLFASKSPNSRNRNRQVNHPAFHRPWLFRSFIGKGLSGPFQTCGGKTLIWDGTYKEGTGTGRARQAPR